MTRVHSSGTNVATQNSASQSVDSWSNISFENTLNYKLNIDRHNIDIVLGQTIEQNKFGEHLEASGNNLLFGDSWDHAYLDNAQIKKLADVSVGGHPTSDSSLASSSDVSTTTSTKIHAAGHSPHRRFFKLCQRPPLGYLPPPHRQVG